jgi:prolyl 4-hydroxylase
MARLLALLAATRAAAALEYCSALNDGQCETLRAHDTGAPVFLDTGSLGGETTLDDLLDTGIKELKYMKTHTSPRKARGASMGAKFRNFRRETLDMRWDDGSKEGVYSGDLAGLGRTSTLSYDGHTFFFMLGTEEVARFRMNSDENVYIIEPLPDDQEVLQSDQYRAALEERAFMKDYAQRTGVPWLAFYPRPKPILNMWPAEFLGGKPASSPSHDDVGGFFSDFESLEDVGAVAACQRERETARSRRCVARHAVDAAAAMASSRDRSGAVVVIARASPRLTPSPLHNTGQTHVVASPHAYTHEEGIAEGDLALSLQVVSHAPQGPRVFLVREMLSQFECDHIIEMGTKVIRESMVGQGGGFKSKTRTSRNGWLRRSASPTLERIYKRFGDVLGIDHELLSSNKNAEELQVVRYQQSQEYAPHHDFGDDGTPEQRFLTLLLYIQLPDKGGATSFPKAADGRGLQVVPARGDAVLFYSMLPDGNADDLALHAGMPIHEGEKWVCNLWVWDPVRK